MSIALEKRVCTGQKPVVLVVEEDRELNNRLCSAMETQGMIPVPVHETRAGVALVKRVQPDLVLVDIGHGNAEALDVCRFITDNDVTNGTPIVVMADSNDTDLRLEAYVSGACRYLFNADAPAGIARAVRALFNPLVKETHSHCQNTVGRFALMYPEAP